MPFSAIKYQLTQADWSIYVDNGISSSITLFQPKFINHSERREEFIVAIEKHPNNQFLHPWSLPSDKFNQMATTEDQMATMSSPSCTSIGQSQCRTLRLLSTGRQVLLISSTLHFW
jgi:hypothetical protein